MYAVKLTKPKQNYPILPKSMFTQSAGAVKYTDCFSAKG